MKVHDLVVIGSGPAGDTAALYAQRAGIQTLVLDKAAFGGQVALTSKIDNYPGAINIDGYSLMESMRSQAQEFGATYESCEVLEVLHSEDHKLFRMTTTAEDIASRAVIACLGSKYALAGFKGEREFTGRGEFLCSRGTSLVSHCLSSRGSCAQEPNASRSILSPPARAN